MIASGGIATRFPVYITYVIYSPSIASICFLFSPLLYVSFLMKAVAGGWFISFTRVACCPFGQPENFSHCHMGRVQKEAKGNLLKFIIYGYFKYIISLKINKSMIACSIIFLHFDGHVLKVNILVAKNIFLEHLNNFRHIPLISALHC